MSKPVVNAYVTGSSVVVLSRDDLGVLQKQLVPAEYVLFLDAKQTGEDFTRELGKSRYVRSLKRDGDWLRVGWADWMIRRDMVDGNKKKGDEARPSPFEERGITVYEGDVSPIRVYLSENDIHIQKPRRCYFDLETDSRVPFSRKEEMRILSWAVVGEDGIKRSAVLQADDPNAERDLIWQFFQAIDAYDQLLAWNGDNFDFPVIRARVDACSIRVEMNRWLWLDHLELFKRMNTASESGEEKSSLALQSVAMSVIGEGKNDFDGSKTWDAWVAGGEAREQLLRYNEQDTALLPKIEAKTGSAALFDTVSDVCRVFPDSKGLQPMTQMDGFMIRSGREKGVRFPTKRHREYGYDEKYAGAYVMEPRAKGIERDVHVADFASLYPSIILTWNMSPETKVLAPINGPVADGTCRSPSRTRQSFLTNKSGLLPDGLKVVLNLRKEWNAKKSTFAPGTPEFYDADRRSTAYKVVANSFYGVLGSPYSRFFDRQIAESITLNGQWLIQETLAEAEKRGMRSLYADTDSCFVTGATKTSFEQFVEYCNTELYPRLLKEQGCTENYIKLAYEKQFRRIVFCSAKRYAGQYEHYKGKPATIDSKPEVKGLEYKRGDAAILARRMQERAINKMIVEGDERAETFRDLLGEEMRRIMEDELPVELVSISKSISKPLKDYATKKKDDGEDAAVPAHVRVAKILEARGADVGEGTRVSYVVTNGDGSINGLIPSEDYVGEFDRFYLWENLVYPPTQRLLQAAFPESDWVVGLEKIRPPKPKRARASAIANGQLGLSVPMKSDEFKQIYVLPVMESFASEEFIGTIKEISTKHPGRRVLMLHLCLDSCAVAVMETPILVSGSAAFVNELQDAFAHRAASINWEMETCGR